MHRAIGLDRRFCPERIARILEHHDADIVLLQEVDVGVPRGRGGLTLPGNWPSGSDILIM